LFLLEHRKLQFSIPTWPRAEFFSQAILFSSRKIAQVKDQLGLDLKLRTTPTERLMVDHVEQVGGGN